MKHESRIMTENIKETSSTAKKRSARRWLFIILAVGVLGLIVYAPARRAYDISRFDEVFSEVEMRRAQQELEFRTIAVFEERVYRNEFNERGFYFATPWVFERRETRNASITALEFENEKIIAFLPETMVSYLYPLDHGFYQEDSDVREMWVELFGAEAISTKWNALSTMLAQTPDDLSPFMSQRRFDAISLLLVGKAMTLYFDSGIYSFDTGHVQGFQFGKSPEESSQIVLIGPDEKLYDMTIYNATQDEIDAVIASVRFE